MLSFPTILIVAPTTLEAGTAAMMWHRKIHNQLPVFFFYLIIQCLWILLLLLQPRDSRNYFYIYLFGDLITLGLGFAVIFELFSRVLEDYEGIRRLGFILYKWAAVVLMFIAVITCASTQGSETYALMTGILALERGVCIVQCGLLAFLFLFAKYLGLSWRNYVFGIAIGFAVFISVELIVASSRWHVGPVGREMYMWLKPLSFDVATLIWAGYVLQREPAACSTLSISDSQLASWNASVLQLLGRQWN